MHAPPVQAVPPVLVDIDLYSTARAFPHQRLWQSSMGSGHAQLGTRVDWRSHLAQAHADLGISGVRMHGFLDDDMSVASSASSFHFYNIDLVTDHLVSVGLHPIFELDYMPRALAKCKDPSHCYYAFHNRGGYKGLVEPPADYAQWHALIHTLGKHLLDRYGIDELRNWRFEVWNEPCPWIGGVDYPAQYEPLYNASATALKSVHPQLQVGGPATATLMHLVDFATRATWGGVTRGSPHRAGRMPLDFLSSHFYPSEHNCTDAKQPLGADPDCFVKTVLAASARVAAARAAAGAPHVPFYLTEFNSGLQGGPGTGEAGPHTDTSYAAAFAIRTIPMLASGGAGVGGSGLVDLASWWTFSDLLDEGWLTGVPFYGGFGLLNSQGVPKPSYRAFELLRGAGTARLVEGVKLVDSAPDYPTIANHSTVSVLVTVDGEGGGGGRVSGAGPPTTHRGLQIFLANFAPMAGASGAPWATPKPRNVSLTLQVGKDGACTPPRRALLRRIDDVSTAPRAAWESMGSPTYPNTEQLAALHKASEVPEETVQLAQPSACAATLGPIEVPAYGIVHIGTFE